VTKCLYCKQERPDVEVRYGQLSCLECARGRALRAAFTYDNLVTEEVVEMTYGWATATCVDGEPVEWLCLHIHSSDEDAEDCLAGRVRDGDCTAPNPGAKGVNS